MTRYKVSDALTGAHLGNRTAATPDEAAQMVARDNGWTGLQWMDLIVVPYCPRPAHQLAMDE